jgi:hypothetical protein
VQVPKGCALLGVHRTRRTYEAEVSKKLIALGATVMIPLGSGVIAQADVLGRQDHHVAAWSLGVTGLVVLVTGVLTLIALAASTMEPY